MLQITPPYTPEKYIEAIQVCEKANMEVIIIDSITHEWEYIIEFHASLGGNSFTNWHKIGLRHKEFINAMLKSKANIIATTRTKQDYVLNEKNGRMVPDKVGLKSIQRDGLEYEFTLVFDINMKNMASASKDRTNLFFNKPETQLSAETGRMIQQWCNEGADVSSREVSQRVSECKSIGELLALYKTYPQFKETLKPEFEQRKRQILIQNEIADQVNN